MKSDTVEEQSLSHHTKAVVTKAVDRGRDPLTAMRRPVSDIPSRIEAAVLGLPNVQPVLHSVASFVGDILPLKTNNWFTAPPPVSPSSIKPNISPMTPTTRTPTTTVPNVLTVPPLTSPSKKAPHIKPHVLELSLGNDTFLPVSIYAPSPYTPSSLLPGETAFLRLELVTYMGFGVNIQGRIICTNYRLRFEPSCPLPSSLIWTECCGLFDVPLALINTVKSSTSSG
eukprot:GHVR01096616.1.p1 GENE.GHVR01096616.1~~GHVR01096616.1.p1  ORF type:complete len:227 (-),score=60.76 GHVR01096616.1:137-817(-)